MDYKPEPHYLRSKMVEDLTWHDVLAELIDNAFDAKANRCEITLVGKRLVVADDGIGSEALPVFIRLGGHKDHSAKVIGMHGRGLKDAWLWLGDDISIKSFRGGNLHSLMLNIQTLLNQEWHGPDPESTKMDGVGTTITFEAVRRTQPKHQTFDNLEKTFMPALLDGRQILIRTHANKLRRLKPYVLPKIEDVVDAEFDIEGKQVAIHIGIVPPDVRNPLSGFLFTFQHRVIMETQLGCDDYTGDRVCGTVTLGRGWRLNPHKTGIAEHKEALGEAIHERIRWILQKAKQQYMNAETEAFVDALESLMKEGLQALKKEKRNPPENATGSIIPRDSGRKRRHASKTQDQVGEIEHPKNKRRTGIRIGTYEADSDELLGKADPMTNLVMLNLTHPVVRESWDGRNLVATYAIAFGIYCHDRCQPGRKQTYAFEIHDFPSAWGIALKTGKFQGGVKDEQVA